MNHASCAATPIARVNGIALNRDDETLGAAELRQRACAELLRQAAIARGTLPRDDAPTADGILSEDAMRAVEALLDENLVIPEPSEEECRRHYEARSASYTTGERAKVRHILFAVTPGVDLAALRHLAEATLLDVRCVDHSGREDKFAEAARAQSNCPSGADGGHLGWLTSAECAPEFAREVFGHREIGVLPRLVHTRFGLHVIEVLQREPGKTRSFEEVRGAVAAALQQQTYVTALRQYLSQLAGQAELSGVDLEAADTPLVQ